MKILFLTQIDLKDINERGIYPDLLREFRDKGHDIFIVSPTSDPIENSIYTKENVTIAKFKTVGNKINLIKKGLDLIFMERKYLRIVKKYFLNIKFDLILYATPPIATIKVIQYIKNKDNAASYLLLKDIFPQNALDLGMLSKHGVKGFVYRYFRNKEKKLYKLSDYIGCMSPANVDYLNNNNKYLANKVVEIAPNSIEVDDILTDNQQRNNIRKKYSIPNDKLVYVYGGNLGKPQGVTFLTQIISNNPNIYVLIIGKGTEYQLLKTYIEIEKPINAQLIPSLPREDYERLVNACDVGLILLDKKFTIPNYPSRLLSYLQASIPVVAATDKNTDIGLIAEENNYGFWCENGDIESFNKIVDKLEKNDLRVQMGKNGRNYLLNNYTIKHTYDAIQKHFES